MLKNRGIDSKRFSVFPVATIEEFRTQAMRILNSIEASDPRKDDGSKIMMCLDSLGSLSTNKEVTDIGEGSDKRDMTRSQLVRGAFRALTLKKIRKLNLS